MASNRLSKLVLVLAALALSAAAQSPTRVRGTIASFDGTTLSVDNARIRVNEKTEIVFTQPIRLADIRPFDGRDDQTMTNATLTTIVGAASGRVLTLGYPGGEQKVTVPENASVSALVPGQRSQLVPGATVNLTAAQAADGALVARRIQVGPRTP